ncbi:MAG: DUF975 family protein [Clostridiales bacterium]|nr:DUF975 family protein [Clostridiales bacterium]
MGTRMELKAIAKEQIRGNLGILFVCSVIPVFVSLIVGGLPSVGPLLAQIIAPAFAMSIVMIYLSLSYGETPKPADAFMGFSIFGKSLWMFIIMEFFIAVWSLLLIVPGVIKALGYAMAPYILAENPDMQAMEALKESERMMNGYKMELFMLGLSFAGWGILVAATFGIAGFYVIPYIEATMTQFYHGLKDA